MPLYNYECQTCAFRFDKLSSQSNNYDITECPRCGQTAKLVISACNFTFGWRLSDRSHILGNPKEEFERNV